MTSHPLNWDHFQVAGGSPGWLVTGGSADRGGAYGKIGLGAWVLSRLARVSADCFTFGVGREAHGKGSAPVTRDQGSLPLG